MIWEKHFEKLFSDDRPDFVVDCELQGPPTLRSEIIHAIKTSPNRKACGGDDVPAEILKLINEDNFHHLLRLFNRIYNTGTIPHDWLKSTFVTLPKKQHQRSAMIIT